ncbi:ABC transporter substrate-binding protein [Balneatrix alpica]|uniref:ABC transporter substrate-binding protein n=1 Tax=Balneatrix alpica TaxID=75684 RepID=A0ABV5Z9A3_9GAMM|nr:iron-siderophore ABC transporter substrate-binding protein [Balneatrix alpica]
MVKPFLMLCLCCWQLSLEAAPYQAQGEWGKVAFTQPPQRIAALNWTMAEMLLSLGVEPIGVTTIEGYRKWQTDHPPMPATVAELGRREEPNLQRLAELQPELILGYDFRHARLFEQLNEIAPTLLFQQYAKADQPHYSYYRQMHSMYRRLAQVLGKTDLAEQQLQTLEQQLQQTRDRLTAAGWRGKPVVFGKFVGMGYGLRVFAPQSLAASLLQQLGLDYAWQQALPGKDFTHLQLQHLPRLGEVTLILERTEEGEGMRMRSSPVWQQLPFVRAGQVLEIEPLWSFGGPVSAQRMLTALEQTLLGKESGHE